MDSTIGLGYGVKNKNVYSRYEKNKKANVAESAKQNVGSATSCMNKTEATSNLAYTESTYGNITLDWADTIYACIESFKKQYPGVNFEISGRADNISPEALAVSSGNGMHMVIAPEFFQGMLMNPESFAKGTEFIQKVLKQLFGTVRRFTANGADVTGMGAVIDAKGKASIWTMQAHPPEESRLKQFFEMMRENNKPNTYKQGGRTITEIKTLDGIIKFSIVKRLGYSTGSDVARLARLTTAGNVRAFIGGLEAYMNQVRSDRFLDKAEISRAVAMMKGVIMRAGVKIKNLQSESILEIVRKNALKAKQAAKVAQISRELQQKRTERKSREHFQKVGNLLPEDYYRDDPSIDDLSSEMDTDLVAMEIVVAEGAVDISGSSGGSATTEGAVVVAEAGSVNIAI